jgi:hypothetical protein
MWQNTFTLCHLLELTRERKTRDKKGRSGSNFPCASWKEFRAPTRVGEGKVRDVNRVAAVGATPSPRGNSEKGFHPQSNELTIGPPELVQQFCL